MMEKTEHLTVINIHTQILNELGELKMSHVKCIPKLHQHQKFLLKYNI